MHWIEPSENGNSDTRLCRMVAVRMNLAVHGLEGDIRHGDQVNNYYDDPAQGDRPIRLRPRRPQH